MRSNSVALALSALLAVSAALATPVLRSGSVQPLSTVTKAKASAQDEQRDWRASLGLYAQAKETCFLKGEKTEGMNKICFYDCASGGAAITVSAVSLCPLSIQK